MKRKITDLEQKLINDGWCLTIKRYTGKHSEKILCYEYNKTSDLRNDNKTYEQFIMLDQKRAQIVKYGIKNVQFDIMSDFELCVMRFLFLELRKYAYRLEQNETHEPYAQEEQEEEPRKALTFEELDEFCKEKE